VLSDHRRCTKNRQMDIDQVYEDIEKGATLSESPRVLAGRGCQQPALKAVAVARVSLRV
jgi:hypothetical protein